MLRQARSALNPSRVSNILIQAPRLSPAYARFNFRPADRKSASLPGPLGTPVMQWQRRAQFVSKAGAGKGEDKTRTSIAQQKLEAHPESVTTTSSTRTIFENEEPKSNPEVDVLGDMKSDLGAIREAVALSSVPQVPYALGLAGTLPYLATSISAAYLGWNPNASWLASSTFLSGLYTSHETAQYWMGLLEPIQLGYGAVIISFLGAIHWGMEFNEKTSSPSRAKFRYGVGVLAPAVAWPTLLMPIEHALITQFAAFALLYLADSRASARGWAPTWYGTYRFVLTFITGSAIVVSLIGRAKVEKTTSRTPERLREEMHKSAETKDSAHWARLEKEEKERLKREEEERKKAEKSKPKKSKKADKDGDTEKSGDSTKSGNSEKSDGSEKSSNPKSDESSKPDASDKPESDKS